MFRAGQVANASPDVNVIGILNPVFWDSERHGRLRGGNSAVGSGAGILVAHIPVPGSLSKPGWRCATPVHVVRRT